MPNKYAEKKGWKVPKQKHKVTNWSAYNEALRRRGNITIWLSEEVIAKWYETERVYDGTGAPRLYTDLAIITCHEIRLVYKLPLRQCQGFIDSLFQLMNVPLSCPDFSVLSKRLVELDLKVPRYKKNEPLEDHIHAIAMDSTGLKRFGRGEWHQEKYELSSKASWRKLHLAINQDHYIEACTLTDRFVHDDQQVEPLLEQIDEVIDHFSGDGAYDETPVYNAVTEHSPQVEVVIPPRANAVEREDAAPQRNRHLIEIKTNGRMHWQKTREYGRRNYAELGIQRYQRTFGDTLHARDFSRQQQEAMLASGALNKMTSLGMPRSYRSA